MSRSETSGASLAQTSGSLGALPLGAMTLRAGGSPPKTICPLRVPKPSAFTGVVDVEAAVGAAAAGAPAAGAAPVLGAGTEFTAVESVTSTASLESVA